MRKLVSLLAPMFLFGCVSFSSNDSVTNCHKVTENVLLSLGKSIRIVETMKHKDSGVVAIIIAGRDRFAVICSLEEDFAKGGETCLNTLEMKDRCEVDGHIFLYSTSIHWLPKKLESAKEE